MGSVIGPFTQQDWEDMRLLRSDIAFMRGLNPIKFRSAIDKERSCLKEYFSREVA